MEDNSGGDGSEIRGDATLCGLGIMMNNEMDINHLFRLIFAGFLKLTSDLSSKLKKP